MQRKTSLLSLTVWVLLGWLCLGVGELKAQETSKKPILGLFPIQAISRSLPQRELQNLSNQILQQFRQNRPYPVSRRYPLVGSPPKVAPVATSTLHAKMMKPLYQQLRLSAKLIQKGRFKLALPQLQKGISLAKKRVKWKNSIVILSRLRGLLALAHLQLGNNEEGETLLQEVARMDPKPVPPELQKNRILARLYKRAKMEVSRSPKVRLQVLGTSQATVYVDGRKRGQIPLDLNNIAKGVHYIRIEKSGHRSWGKSVLLAKPITRKQVNLKRIPPRQITPEEQAHSTIKTQILLLQLQSTALRNALPTICRAGKINFLLGGHLQKVGKEYYLFTPIVMACKTQKVTKGEPIQLNTDLLDVDVPIYRSYLKLLKVKKKTTSVAILPPRRPPPRRGLPFRRPPPGTPPTGAAPAHKTWWFWTLITVGVVGGAAAATTVYILNQPPRISVQANWSALKE